ncbi:MAG: 14.7 kDa ribonuclease H-like protein [Syntrophaceae bacterium PtaU1.Bin231]|nr:MAG: 14.7 kDa ribonuclease H-like protein [Syntrophaceae bacterium PtaU1.Bin231]
MTEPHCTLFADGACRGNPGRGGAGAVLMDVRGAVLATGKKYLGQCTNNIAEYEALILGLEEALKRRCLRLHIRLDSELLVKQVRGEYKVKNPHLKILMERVRHLLSELETYTIQHTAREGNALADALANEAIDGMAEEISSADGKRVPDRNR